MGRRQRLRIVPECAPNPHSIRILPITSAFPVIYGKPRQLTPVSRDACLKKGVGGAPCWTRRIGVPMFKECRHIKTNGLKCKSPALRGMPYCYFHARLHRASKGPRPLKIASLETSKDIQIALAKVLARLSTSPRGAREAEFYLWALQIASQNVNSNRPVREPNGSPVHRTCQGPKNCAACREENRRGGFKPKEAVEPEQKDCPLFTSQSRQSPQESSSAAGTGSGCTPGSGAAPRPGGSPSVPQSAPQSQTRPYTRSAGSSGLSAA